ncbi:MAG: hypothetical protein LBP83_00210 [Dysgonamonadaceae bacterium]|jgi:hypothetical protein|nr:hypothetical protein [Dysgonamonadaceae bacterium]
MQTTFYDTLPPLPEVDRAVADFAFFLYDLEAAGDETRLDLTLKRTVYTKFDAVLEQIAKFEAGSLAEFTQLLQKKLDSKRLDIDNFETIVVE